MPNPNRQQKLRDLEQRYKRLHEKLTGLQQEYDLETRSDEKLRLQQQIDAIQPDLTSVENEFRATTREDTLSKLHEQLFQLKRNRAFAEALATAREIEQIAPDTRISRDIQRLENKLEQREQANHALGQLMRKIGELGMPFYQKIAPILGPQNKHDDSLESLLQPTQLYLNGEIDAQTYQQLCEPLLTSNTGTHTNDSALDYAELTRKIRDGDIVLFIGSDIPNLYNDENWGENNLASKLAETIRYTDFSGNLSSIAELYQLRLDYGQKSLIEYLNQSFSQLPSFPLYNALACSEQNLILISSTYDDHLEQAFQRAGKPFVELSSIIHRTQHYDVGHVVVHFSDTGEEEILPQEELSRRDLLKTHSIIYKIRGTCALPDDAHTARKDSLTLSETNYFTFAENAGKIIPDFLASHLRERSFLFIGFTPRSWEDRLLARILLEKRKNSSYLCYTLGKPNDQLQQAYWKKQNVEYSQIDFEQLDAHLQGECA